MVNICRPGHIQHIKIAITWSNKQWSKMLKLGVQNSQVNHSKRLEVTGQLIEKALLQKLKYNVHTNLPLESYQIQFWYDSSGNLV